MVEGGMKCVKYLLFTFNLIFVIVAIALIAAGAYTQIKLKTYDDFFGSEYAGPGILTIVVGTLIFIIAFFGCMGALKENYCMTMTFAILLAFIFILMIAGAIAAYVLRDDIESEVVSILIEEEKDYNIDPEVTQTWDQLQREFACCGVVTYQEWEKLNLNTTYPQSCCKNEMSNECSSTRKIPSTAIKTKPCKTAFVDWIKEQVTIIGGVAIGVAVVMVVGVVFACCLARAIRREYEVV